MSIADMERSTQEIERMRKVALTGAALAVTGLALRYRKPFGEMISSAEIWEKSESVVVDLIGASRDKSIRLFAGLIRNAQNEVVDVTDVQLVNDDGTDAQIASLEDAFTESDGSA